MANWCLFQEPSLVLAPRAANPVPPSTAPGRTAGLGRKVRGSVGPEAEERGRGNPGGVPGR